MFHKREKTSCGHAGHQAEAMEEDQYDGYYDDILPPDLDHAGEGIDRNLVKRIIALGIGVMFIVSMCILILYLF